MPKPVGIPSVFGFEGRSLKLKLTADYGAFCSLRAWVLQTFIPG